MEYTLTLHTGGGCIPEITIRECGRAAGFLTAPSPVDLSKQLAVKEMRGTDGNLSYLLTILTSSVALQSNVVLLDALLLL